MSNLFEDTRPLSEREQRQLQRLLSDPTMYPNTLKGWLVPYLEASDLDMPLANVHGLLEELNELGARLRTLERETTLGGTTVVLTDAGGQGRVNFPAPVSTVKSVVVVNGDQHTAPATYIGVVEPFDLAGFTVEARLVGGGPVVTSNVRVNWLALVEK